MSKFWTIVSIRDGKIINPKAVKTLFDSLKDGKYLIDVSGADKRSSPQNRFYWGIVVPMILKGFKDLGTEATETEVHEFLKARFNAKEVVNEGTGEVVILPLSTTRLNKQEFSEYIEKIQRFSSEFLNTVIPDPGTQLEINA